MLVHRPRARGGLDAEREERKLVKAEEEERNRRNFEAMQEMRKEGWRKVCALCLVHPNMLSQHLYSYGPASHPCSATRCWQLCGQSSNAAAFFIGCLLTICMYLCVSPQRREKEGLVAGDTDPALDEFSDDEYVFQVSIGVANTARNNIMGLRHASSRHITNLQSEMPQRQTFANPSYGPSVCKA